MRKTISASFRLVLAWMCIQLSHAEKNIYATETTVTDIAYKDACGPFSCLVALKLLGINSSLERIGRECVWSQHQPVKLSTMQQVLNSYSGVECQLVQLTPKELCDLLRDDQSVAILAVRKNSGQINHAVCAASVDSSKDIIRWYDYPELEQHKQLAEVTEVWDGAALVVRVSFLRNVIEQAGLLVLPTLSVVYLIGVARRRMQV